MSPLSILLVIPPMYCVTKEAFDLKGNGLTYQGVEGIAYLHITFGVDIFKPKGETI